MIEQLNRLVRGESLAEAEVGDAMRLLMAGEATPVQVAGFLVALRMKGETVDELAGLARTAREFAVPVAAGTGLLDTCGTGGDGKGTINISTLSAIVAAACGARVAKHGNRSASSTCGSADLLEALGVRIDLGPEGVVRCIEHAGIGFMFAPVFHPAFRHAAVARRELGIRTVFNLLGPLANPAHASFQALGVADAAMAPRMAEVLARLGVERAVVFHSSGGMDELSLSGASEVHELSGGSVRHYLLEPSELGLEAAPDSALLGGDAVHNATLATAVLGGEGGPRRDVVLLNTAAALRAAGLVAEWRDGVEMAAVAIDSGRAAGVLERWIEVSQGAGEAVTA